MLNGVRCSCRVSQDSWCCSCRSKRNATWMWVLAREPPAGNRAAPLPSILLPASHSPPFNHKAFKKEPTWNISKGGGWKPKRLSVKGHPSCSMCVGEDRSSPNRSCHHVPVLFQVQHVLCNPHLESNVWTMKCLSKVHGFYQAVVAKIVGTCYRCRYNTS